MRFKSLIDDVKSTRAAEIHSPQMGRSTEWVKPSNHQPVGWVRICLWPWWVLSLPKVFWSQQSPWYNHPGWLGVKKKSLIYLITLDAIKAVLSGMRYYYHLTLQHQQFWNAAAPGASCFSELAPNIVTVFKHQTSKFLNQFCLLFFFFFFFLE